MQKDDFMLSVDFYYKKFDCGKEKARHLNVAEFSTFWRKFTKIYTTIDADGSGEVEFCELMRYLKICAHKMRVSKELCFTMRKSNCSRFRKTSP